MLNRAYETVIRDMADGVFTVLRPSGIGPGKRAYLLMTEVEAFAHEGRAGVERLRAAAAKAAKPRKETK